MEAAATTRGSAAAQAAEAQKRRAERRTAERQTAAVPLLLRYRCVGPLYTFIV